MDYIGKDNAIYLRHTNPLQLDLAAKFSWELANKIMALGDQEALRLLDHFATNCVTSFDERLLLWDDGSYQYKQQCLTSFRDPDVVLKLETAKSEIVIEITDPAKRLLCPRLGEDYVKRMLHPSGTQRANVLYIAIKPRGRVANRIVHRLDWKLEKSQIRQPLTVQAAAVALLHCVSKPQGRSRPGRPSAPRSAYSWYSTCRDGLPRPQRGRAGQNDSRCDD